MKHAIIGCGTVAPNHVFGIQFANQDITLVCCDVDRDKAQAFANKYNISEVYTDYHELLQDSAIESVSICTDHGSHARLTIDALNAGKHVIVEKPIALSLQDSDDMINVSTRNNRVLSVISQHRYTPEVQYILELIEGGVFGSVVTISGTLNSHKDSSYYQDSYWRGTLAGEGGSTLINQAIHTLDLMVHIMGQPRDITAHQANLKFNEIETEDTIAGIFRFSNGALGTILSTNASSKFWDSKIEIVGTKGNIAFTTGFPLEVKDLYLADSVKQQDIERKIRHYEDTAANEVPPTQDYYGVSHKYQIKNFIDTIKGVDELTMPPKEARNTLETVLDIYTSTGNRNTS